jgi:hypothetical protein
MSPIFFSACWFQHVSCTSLINLNLGLPFFKGIRAGIISDHTEHGLRLLVAWKSFQHSKHILKPLQGISFDRGLFNLKHCSALGSQRVKITCQLVWAVCFIELPCLSVYQIFCIIDGAWKHHETQISQSINIKGKPGKVKC